MIKPLFVDSSLMTREIPILIVVNFIAVLCLWDLELGLTDSLILLTVLVISQYLFIRSALQKGNPKDDQPEEIQTYHYRQH